MTITDLLIKLVTNWVIDFQDKEVKRKHFEKFGPIKWPPYPEDLGWDKLKLSAGEIERLADYYEVVVPEDRVLPSAEELLKTLYGDPDEIAERYWIKIRAALSGPVKEIRGMSCDDNCIKALDGIGGMYVLSTMTFRDLRLAEQDFKRLYKYYWREQYGLIEK